MSDYCRHKVVRMKVNLESLGVSSLWDIEDEYEDLFGNGDVGKFDIAPTEEDFIDYVLYRSYGEECGEWGKVRKLKEKESEKYVEIFQQIYPNVKPEDLRYVDFCWYNCSEAPDYFDEASDDFYDEI